MTCDGSGNQNVIVDANGKLVATSLTTAYTLPAATSTSLGGVKVGNGLNVDAAGELSVDPNGIVHPRTVEASGEAHRNSNVEYWRFHFNSTKLSTRCFTNQFRW